MSLYLRKVFDNLAISHRRFQDHQVKARLLDLAPLFPCSTWLVDWNFSYLPVVCCFSAFSYSGNLQIGITKGCELWKNYMHYNVLIYTSGFSPGFCFFSLYSFYSLILTLIHFLFVSFSIQSMEKIRFLKQEHEHPYSIFFHWRVNLNSLSDFHMAWSHKRNLLLCSALDSFFKGTQSKKLHIYFSKTLSS